MLRLKTIFNSTYQFQRLFSLYKTNNEKNSISSAAQLNSTIKTLIDTKQFKQAVDLCYQNLEKCTNYTISIAINACNILNDYQRGIDIKEKNPSNALKNSYIQTSLIRFYSLISNNMPEKVLDLLDEMTFKLDKFILAVLLNACGEVANDRGMKIGRKLLDDMLNNYQNDIVLLNSAIDMLMKFGDVQGAERIFDSIKKKDIVTYGAMMKGYIRNEMYEKSLDLFEQINFNVDDVTYIIVINACAQLANDRAIKIGKKLLHEMPNIHRNNNVLLTSAINMLMKFGEVENAERFVKLIRNKNIMTYGALMNGYDINGEPWKCLKILQEIKQKNIVLNEIIWNLVIGSCSQIGMIRQAEYIIYDRGTVTYNAMINGFGLNGMDSEAIELYREMPNNLHNEISHICVLNACSYSGLLHQTQNIFNEINLKREKIVTVMVDCLSRLFLFDEALNMVDEYEKKNSPHFVMYMCLLSGARSNRNRNLSEKICNRMKYLFPDKKQRLVSGVILLSNMYSSVGEHQLAKSFRSSQIKELEREIKIGLSWTDANGEIVAFKAHDHSHPQSREIHAEADLINRELIEDGYKCDSSWVTRELHEEETIESALCGHSERLVVAFNFIQRPIPEFIQV
ncbi:unnamed protein product, partial [Rotaria sp. Silwood2]